MSPNEEDLQRRIERGEASESDGLNGRAYREVFRVLAKEPYVKLSNDFADSVLRRVIEKQQRGLSRDYFWFGVGLVLLLIAFVVAIAMVGPKLHLGFLREMSGYAGLFIFGVAFLVTLNWLDKRIVQKRPEEVG